MRGIVLLYDKQPPLVYFLYEVSYWDINILHHLLKDFKKLYKRLKHLPEFK